MQSVLGVLIRRLNIIKSVYNNVFIPVATNSSLGKFLSLDQLRSAQNVHKHRLLKVIRKEYSAVCNLFKRSGFPLIDNQGKESRNQRQFHSTSSPNQRRPNSDKKSNKDDEDNKLSPLLAKAVLWMLTAYMVVAVVSLMFPRSNKPEVIRYVAWNEFLHQMLAKGEVEEIIVRPDVDIVTIILREGAVIKGKKIDHKMFHMVVYDIGRFEDKLREAEKKLGIRAGQGIPVMYERSSDTAGKLLASMIVAGILLSLLSRNRSIRPPISMDTFSHLGRAKFTLVDPLAGHGRGVHFVDVAGLQEAKLEVMEFVDYLKRPEHYKSLGAKVPRGALLLGPPGCGKTLLAKAVATESNVPFLSMNGSEFVEMIGGLGAARVRDLFKEARKRSPCIIYIDEIDAVGRKRTAGGTVQFDGASGEGEQTLNQLLVEMDGMASKEGVVVLASTNRADVLDKALLRPGRFDRHILIDLPTIEERKLIIEQHLKKIALEYEPQHYSKRMAQLTPGFSGADIANICNEAALHAARYKQSVVKGSDLEYAIERLVGGPEKRSHVMSQQEKKVVAYHEAGHALVGWLLTYTDALLKVTIVPRTNHSLGFSQYIPSDRRLYSKEELFERMCMTLGGRVAESIMFNQITTSAKDDLKLVTKMAYDQVRHFGMNTAVGLVSFPEETDGSEVGRRPYSKKMTAVMDVEVNKLIATAYKRTEEILRQNQDKLKLLAETLLEQETLNYEEVVNLIGPPCGNKREIKMSDLKFNLSNEEEELDKETEENTENPKIEHPKSV